MMSSPDNFTGSEGSKEIANKEELSLTSLNEADPAGRDESKSKSKKHVGFAPEPTEDLRAHHKEVQEHREEKLKSNPFWKIPPELSYLEKLSKSPAPKPIIPTHNSQKTGKHVRLEDLPDLPIRAVKEISAINKGTPLNFNYHEVVLPIGPDRILVEVKYASLSSFDLSKLKKYNLNLSYERVGIGYDFVGEIVALGKNYNNSEVFVKGMKVFGVTNPVEKKGALQTCVIINPTDVIIPITDEDIKDIGSVDMELDCTVSLKFQLDDDDEEVTANDLAKIDDTSASEDKANATRSTKIKKRANYEIEKELPTLAKLATFGSQYCRAKQALEPMLKIFKKQKTANILINGADTHLGLILMQILSSSVYRDVLDTFNVILVVAEKNSERMTKIAEHLGSGGMRNFHVVTFDMINDDIVLPGERIPINYKKVPYFATELFESMFKIIPSSEKIGKRNLNNIKLDLLVDIIGCKKMFQKLVNITKIDAVNFPFKERLEADCKPSAIFGETKEPLFLKLMKPKASGSTIISFCDFNTAEPSYLVMEKVKFKSRIVDPWGLSWVLGLANQFVGGYNYYEKFDLQIKQSWVEEGFKLVRNGELRVQIDERKDWRDDFRLSIERLMKHDSQVTFKIEAF